MKTETIKTVLQGLESLHRYLLNDSPDKHVVIAQLQLMQEQAKRG